MKKNKVSQQQIAKDLGVSQTLVSMVLNGRKEGISKESVQRILDHAQKHRYTPKGMHIDMTSSLMGSATIETVGFILRSPLKLATKSNFFRHVHQGMHEELNLHGVKTLFLGSEDDLNEEDYDKITRCNGTLRGIILLGQVKTTVIQAISRSKLPVVSVSASYSGLCHSVLPNEVQAGERLVEHLHKLGHRHFGWIGGDINLMRYSERLNAFTSSLQSRQLTCNPNDSISLENANRQAGFDAMQTILSNRKKKTPTAIVCYNGMMARGAIDNLLLNRIEVGKDISIVAFDYTKICEESPPKITCCGSSPELMGATAARLITQDLNATTGAFSELTLPTEFLEYQSSGPAPAVSALS